MKALILQVLLIPPDRPPVGVLRLRGRTSLGATIFVVLGEHARGSTKRDACCTSAVSTRA